ncbi:hypothetical protein ACP70R_038119 [Stipagrostis hirtigluma subsp. patula]
MGFSVASLPVAPPLPPPSSAAAAWRRRAPPRLVLVASTRDGQRAPPTFGRLREELLQLHAEADLTQSRANSARARLVRLTEAAENLKRRAATSVRMGRENEAVDLLVQKKKLTKALENIKERIEVLDKLSAKISEAISMKQNLLIEHALCPEMSNGENSNDKIRVFSSKVNDWAKSSDSLPNSVEKEYIELRNEVHANMVGCPEQSELQMANSFKFSSDHDPDQAYEDFLEHIDLQLKLLACEIEQFVSSHLVEDVGTENQINSKRHRLSDVLKFVKEISERVEMILNKAEETGYKDLRSMQTPKQ